MCTLLIVVGLIWAALGVDNIVSSYDTGLGSAVANRNMLFVIIPNAMIYLFPGLILAGIGALVRQRSSVGLVPCPHCAEKIRREAKICRFCQRDLPAPQTREAGPSVERAATNFDQARAEQSSRLWRVIVPVTTVLLLALGILTYIMSRADHGSAVSASDKAYSECSNEVRGLSGANSIQAFGDCMARRGFTPAGARL